jgi:hypothetical protein
MSLRENLPVQLFSATLKRCSPLLKQRAPTKSGSMGICYRQCVQAIKRRSVTRRSDLRHLNTGEVG